MNDEKLKALLRRTLRSLQTDDTPGFDQVWAAAQERYGRSRSRYRRFAVAAALAAVAVTLFLLSPQPGNDLSGVYLTDEELMGSTHWRAPSDVLLPEFQIDIYGELPVLMETNDLNEGSLL